METTRLGKTDIVVPRLCVGSWQAAGWSSCDDDRFCRTLAHAIDRGLTFIDTAEGYGAGHSEQLVGKTVKGRRDQVVLATKFGPGSAATPEKLREALERSLRNLQTDYVDLYQHHWPGKQPPLDETLAELQKLKQEGKIRAVGVSNYMEPEWDEVSDPSVIDCLQPNHSLLWRSIEPAVLPLCRQHGIAVIPYSPLCQGILAGKFHSLDELPQERDPRKSNRRLTPDQFPAVLKVVEAVERVAAKVGKTPAQVAIRWLLDQPGITAPIVGASRPEQVDQNLGALGWTLDRDDWQQLADISWPLSADLHPHDALWGWHPRER